MNTAKHAFGGAWTNDKLELLRKYLCAYTTIFKGNPRARYFTTIYVDAFAGTGQRVATSKSTGLRLRFFDADARAFKKGSARIALEVEPPFDQFLFIERSRKRIKALEQLRLEFPSKSVSIQRGDANSLLKKWCKQTDWQRHRAVVFLDPYGMQVEWATLQAIAETKAIDLWLLFPLGVAVSRLLTKNKPPPGKWADALTRIFGTEEWKDAFYPKRTEQTFFGLVETRRRQANFDRIGQFLVERLKTIFAEVVPKPLELCNSKNVPIYLFCFAAGNPRGAKTAVRIAADILKKPGG